MSWHRDGSGGRRSYHHGNLREALISAALELIAQKGPAGFTFAEAARAAGVSPAAPYRHFRDRDALMADVARRGFERFEQRLAAAWDEGRPSPLAALERMGRAYLGFAREEPAYFSAMFEAGVPLADHRELQEAGDRAFGVLRGACEVVVAGLPAGKRPPAMMMALHIWVALARHRQPVCPRRRGAADLADDAGGAAGGRDADLSAGARDYGEAVAAGRNTPPIKSGAIAPYDCAVQPLHSPTRGPFAAHRA